MQIGLMILGFDLPKHGVDGLFGPETASSVQKFATDNNINITSENPIKESVQKIKLSLLEVALISPLDKTSVNSGFGSRGGGSHNGVDLAANAASLGINVIDIKQTASAIADLHAAVKTAKQSETSTLIHINSDPLLYSPGGEGWWDVPIAPVSNLKSTQDAYAQYKVEIQQQRPLLGNGTKDKK